MNRGELVSFVQDLLGRDDQTSLIQTQLNEVLKSLAKLHYWTDLQTSTTGSFTSGSEGPYSLPSDFHKLLNLELTGSNNKHIVPLRYTEANVHFPDLSESSEGTPSWYIPYGGGIYLQPIPDSNYDYKLWYSKWPAAMSADSDNPDITNQDTLLAYFTTWVMSDTLGLVEDAESFRARVFSEYPRGPETPKRGLLPQAIRDDKTRPDRLVVKRPYNAYETHKGQPIEQPLPMNGVS